MPCVQISTNVCLDGVDTDSIFSDVTKVVAQIIGRAEHFVMVILKGDVAISFERNKDPAAYAEIISMGGITPETKKQLIYQLGTILLEKLSIPRTRFFVKVYDTTMATAYSKSKL
uniref:macrophage migration inhibitory factor homolog n=1 Tax=Erigeron canadensis TaxID=72917 RepID=UPI001CB90851|nr:macrophage migration inhibitory factor homolog [Erigeron canadensis]